jgi:uncharacterized membrane protein YkoI
MDVIFEQARRHTAKVYFNDNASNAAITPRMKRTKKNNRNKNMKYKHYLVVALIVGNAVAGSLGAGPAPAAEEKETAVQGSVAVPKNTSESALAGLAAIPAADAINRATANHPGKPLSAKLENEDGFAVWAVEIADAKGGATEVIVDAGNGAILKTQSEKADREGGEDKEQEGDHEDKD